MGLRAIDAVQRHSRYNEDLPTPENFAPYRIMTAIAWYADDSGVAGVVGNHKECPSINTIADRANVHRNTVLNWLPRLQEAGELRVDKYGAGRGAHLVYTILLEISPIRLPPGSENGTSHQTGDVPISEDESGLLVQEMTEIKRLLVQQNGLLVQALVQGIGTNGTSHQTGDVPDPFDPYFDPILIQEEEGTPLPPYPAKPVDEVTGDEAEELAMWQTAVELASRWAKHRGTYRRLDPQKQDDANDYFRPILGLVVECEGDGEQAWQMMESQCERMVADGLTVVRAGPVVSQIRNEQQRALLPASAPQNGRPNSRAEEVAAAYAAKRQEYFNG